jgi:ACS family tartrate transporter-like MFS transporter
VVLLALPDRPQDAKWLTPEERRALELEIEADKVRRSGGRHLGFIEALRHPKVLLLTLAYFFIVTGNYGIEFFLPSILEKWYTLKLNDVTWLVIIPPALALCGQLFIGWNSDRTKERRLHAIVPIFLGTLVLAVTPLSRGHLALTVVLFVVAYTCMKSYLPAFWALPSLFLTRTAAAGSIGLINSLGNLGGFVGPSVLGAVEKRTGSFAPGLYYLCVSMTASVLIIFLLGLGRREAATA